MAIIVGENTWVTILEADAYLTTRIGTAAWFALPDTAGAGLPSKELYLIMAFNMLVNHPSYCLDATLTTDDVKNAQTELAFYFVSSYDSFIQQSDIATRGVSSFGLSKWTESYFRSWEGDFPLPVMVSMYISSYKSDGLMVDLTVSDEDN